MYPIGTSKHIVFDRPGLARLFCNIHPNMAAYVMAVDTPFYAISDRSDAFAIAGIPSSTYTYSCMAGWGSGVVRVGHRRYGTASRSSVVARRTACACLVIAALADAPMHAQNVAAELDLTAGYSGEEIRAAASQLRVFGEAPTGIGFFVEAALGNRWAGDAPAIGAGLNGVDPIGTDVFGAAYPYSGRVKLMEAYAERSFTPRGALLGVRAGRFRMPFGIYNRSDYSYAGFIRPPLIRYDGYFRCPITGSKMVSR